MSSKGPGGPFSPSFHALRVGLEHAGALLAGYLAEQLLMATEEAADLIDFGSVQIDGRCERRPGRLLQGGEEIRVYWPWNGTRRTYEIAPHRILFRDRYLIAYDKEPGTPSQQTPSDAYNNLYAALQRHLGREGVRTPYVAIHHRLDQETSGVILFAVDRAANRRLGDAFEQHGVTKDYLAWVAGSPSEAHWVSREDITRKGGRYQTCPRGQGKAAETAFRVIARAADRTLLQARPRTGRTHQIRLHLSAKGHPILGDRPYGGAPADRLYLHACRLHLEHPVTRDPLTLTAPVPSNWPEPHLIPETGEGGT